MRTVTSMIRYGLLIGLLMQAYMLIGQRHDYNWLFGYDSFNPFDTLNDFGGSDISFNHSPPLIYRTDREMNINSSNAIMSDADGELIFYTNGCFVARGDHERMMGGDSLTPSNRRFQLCPDGFRSQQGAVALPWPGIDDRYIILHKTITLVSEPLDAFTDKLYYSIVDMGADDGNGAVILKNQVIIDDTLNTADLTACKHADNESWWFFVHKERGSNRFFKFLLSSEGVSGPMVQDIGAEATIRGSGAGQACFSPDGMTYAYYDRDVHLNLYDFDRATGELSNHRQIWVDDNTGLGGVAISPNSRFVYVMAQDNGYQYDLWSSNIKDSEVHIAEYDGWTGGGRTLPFFQAQLAPDCRIYINSPTTVKYLHIIHHPDEKGLACEMEQHGVRLPTRHFVSLPNFPNYRLGTGEVCDSSLVTPIFNIPVPTVQIDVYPNPGIDRLHIDMYDRVIRRVQMYTIHGHLVMDQAYDAHKDRVELDVGHLINGVYVIKIMDGDGSVWSEKWSVVK